MITDLWSTLFNGEDTESTTRDVGSGVKRDGLHESRDAVAGEDLYQLVGRGPRPEVLLPAPSHDVKVEDGITQLLGNGGRCYFNSRGTSDPRNNIYRPVIPSDPRNRQ